MTRYKEICGRLDYADLDLPAAFARRPLPPDLLRIVGYMHDVEQHTTCYIGEALADVLRAHGEPGGAPRVAAMRQRLRNRIGNSPLTWLGMSSLTKHFLAVHMTFGVINEWTTQAGYARLAALAEHDTLSELLRRIKRQEGLHIDYYLTQARRYLGVGSGAQRTARLILRTLWRPVGATVMPESETAHLIQTLFGDDQGRVTAARIDRRIDSLPGLDGLGLIDGALRRYIAA